jgi:hypothetical protein
MVLFSAVVAPNRNDSPPDFTNTENLTKTGINIVT